MKRILAAGALGLGLGTIGAIANVNNTEPQTASASQATTNADQDVQCVCRPDLVLVFADDYHPGIPFRPINRLPQDTVSVLLGRRSDDATPVVSDPTDYRGYIVLVRPTPNAPGKYAFVFVHEQTLKSDQLYRFTTDVTVFEDEILLLQAGIDTAGDAGETTTTPPDQTTYDIIVDAETTTEMADGG